MASLRPTPSQLIRPASKSVGDGAVSFTLGAAVGVQAFPLPLNLGVVDPVVLWIMLAVFASGAFGQIAGLFRWAVFWIWLIVLGSLLGMLRAPHLEVALLQLSKDLYAYLLFLALLAWLVSRPSTWRPMLAGLVFIGVVCAALSLVSSDFRASGTFQNPNYAGHFLAMLIVLLVALRKNVPRAWMLVIPLYVLGLVRAGSFGAVVMLAVGLGVLIWVSTSKLNGGKRALLRASIVASMLVVLFSGVVPSLLQGDVGKGTGLETVRFEKSSTGREERYRLGLRLALEYKTGAGPGQALYLDSGLADHELHNDYVAYLVERSGLGLVGLLGLLWGVWRFAPQGGASRAVLVMVAVGSLVRETLNYRHLWVILAIALVFDWRKDKGESGAGTRTGIRGLTWMG